LKKKGNFEKKRKKQKKGKISKKKKRKKSVWITVVIHSEMCVGEQ
jgi:hypothetical protein